MTALPSALSVSGLLKELLSYRFVAHHHHKFLLFIHNPQIPPQSTWSTGTPKAGPETLDHIGSGDPPDVELGHSKEGAMSHP